MPFNERGEIIRNSGGRGVSPTPQNNQSQPESYSWILWLIGIIVAIIIVYSISQSSKSGKETQSKQNGTQYAPPQNDYPPTNYAVDTAVASVEYTNPYGSGNGKLTLYKTCENCPDLEVFIDGNKIGTISSTYRNGIPLCDDSATISTILTTGEHSLYAKDGYGGIWDIKVSVTEGECKPQILSKNDDTKPNPYGNGNGQLTIYNTYSNFTNIKVYADDNNFLGNFTQYYKDYGSPYCGQTNGASITTVLTAGNHKITASDENGNSWSGYVNVQEGECKIYQPENFQKYKPFGEGNGQVTIYHTCTTCSNVRVYVDDYSYAGTLTRYYYNYSTPTCGAIDNSSISKTLTSGNHKITAEDDNGNKWSGYVYISESQCKTYSLENFSKANPYGEGNGQISFWTSNSIIYDIYVGNMSQTNLSYQGALNSYFSNGAPLCGQSGTLSLILPTGRYKFSATSNRYNGWEGEFVVIEGKCSNFKVNGN